MKLKRLRALLADAWCLTVDWLEPVGDLYRSEGPFWRRVLGGTAQVAWFRLHNNRLYRWLDEARCD